MKIVYVGAFRFPIFDAGASRVLNNGKALLKIGCKVQILSWGGVARDADLQRDGSYCYQGLDYIVTNDLVDESSFFNKAKAKLSCGKNSLKWLKNNIEDIDIIISYNADFCFTSKLVKFTSKYRVKYINDIDEWFSYKDYFFLSDMLFNYFNMNYLQKKVMNKIVITELLNTQYQDSHNIIIPPLSDAKDNKWSGDCINIPRNSIETKRFIYAGNPNNKDLLHLFINVINRICLEGYDVQFLILGISKKDYMKKYSHLLLDINLHDDIKFIGKVSQEIVPLYYKASDFMVLSRNVDRRMMAGFPTKFVESMMSSTPVIANLTSDLDKYLIDGYNGFILKSTTENCMYQLLKDKVLPIHHKKLLYMKDNAKDTAIKSFDYNCYLDTLTKYIHNLR